MIDRIKKIVDYENISIRAFEQKIGASNGLIRKAITNNTDIQGKWLSIIVENYPHINSEWLLTGSGEMLKEKTVKQVAIKSNQGIPLVTQSAVAGFGSSNFSISEQDVKDYYVIPKFKYNRVDFMIEVSGSSMYPKYNSGDIVACTIIKEESFIQWNKCHVIATKEQGILVKRIKKGDADDKILAISDNKDYDPFQIPKKEITGIALVIGVIRLE